LRHLVFWIVHVVIFTFVFWPSKGDQAAHLVISTMWAFLFMVYCYPVIYWVIPRYLLKEKYLQFAIIMFLWAVAGMVWNYICRAYIYFPLADILHFNVGTKNRWAPASLLIMNLMTGFASMIVLFKYWIKKQRDFLSEKNEKINAELQLLKAQIHPHFLFNTLNNIYSYSLKNAAQTSQMILKLSSLLRYILYDCKANEVMLDREIDAMKNYIDLEKERYANRLEISMNVEGDTKGKYIAPLLLLPFLENAFKHGTSDQLEKPWLSMDISVKQNTMRCKIVNSKNETVKPNENGIGISNVKTRLAYLYPGNHELKLVDEGNFFVVSLLIELTQAGKTAKPEKISSSAVSENIVV
jgi:hypothetical protein